MQKKHLAVLLCSAAFMITGCSKHATYVGPALEKSYDSDKLKKDELVAISARFSQGGGFTPGDNGIESVYYAMQLAAEDTLKKGKKYFSIYRPIAISDFEGKGLGSAKAFEKKWSDPNSIDTRLSANA